MNWRELPAGRDLDRVVAERLGWRVELETEGYWRGSCVLVNPAGNRVKVPDSRKGLTNTHILRTTIDEGWATEEVNTVLPRWSADANTALALPIDDNLSWIIDHSGIYLMKDIGWAEDMQTLFEMHDMAIAEGITRCWLSWKDSRNSA